MTSSSFVVQGNKKQCNSESKLRLFYFSLLVVGFEFKTKKKLVQSPCIVVYAREILHVCSEFSTFSEEKFRGFLAPKFPILCLFSDGLLGVEPVVMWLLFHEDDGFIKLK